MAVSSVLPSASDKGGIAVARLVAYWLVVLAAAWTLTFRYMWVSDKAFEYYEVTFAEKLFQDFKNEMVVRYGDRMVGLVVPMMFAASVAAFLVTDTKLPAWRFSWINKVFAYIRRFRADDAEYGRHIAKRNQFALGEQNFNMLAIWFIVLPGLIACFAYIPFEITDAAEKAVENMTSVGRERWMATSELFGQSVIFSMTFFLIPVARHSVLLTAVGWSAVHSLRIHIWAGYLAFWFACLHVVTMFVVFLGFDKIPLHEQFMPPAECWAKNADFTPAEGEQVPLIETCDWKWLNLTGAFAMLWFFILWATSLNWVRRNNYRLFYVCHVLFGTLMILTTFLHYEVSGIYLLPSTAYYLASTAPPLIQALASRFRGGAKIVRVIALQDAGGCMELHIAADAEASTILKKEPGLYVKLCVPKISLIWHPFTVYRHSSDQHLVRVLFRPVGPFTKLFAMHLASPERPVTILDGFYRGSDRIAHALKHDSVTIIAGGVAITPFLSFIPSLLDAVEEQAQENRILSSLTFHWAVRETGLQEHIIKEYLQGMMTTANRIHFKFQVKIYQTGNKTKTIESSDIETYDKDAVIVEPVIDETSAGSDSEDLVKGGASMNILPIDSTPGVSMEVARLMPARFSQMYRNVPYAAAYVGFLWLGFHMTFFRFFRDDDINYSGYIKISGYTIILIILSIFYGALVEGIEFLCRKYFPAAKADSFVLEERKMMDKIEGHCEFDATKMETRTGRPTVDQLLVEAKIAEAPGIFLCGPAALCDGVWKEVRKENSLLGRTRYCMYDEPFEM